MIRLDRLILFFLLLSHSFGFQLYCSVYGGTTDLEAFKNAIRENRTKVGEFKFIQELAKDLGIRIYLFGGTAAGFLNYLRSHLDETQKGTADPSWDILDIYRSNQDIDLVVDGPNHKIAEFQERLVHHFPNQERFWRWEIRSLRQSFSYKAPLLDHWDFLNQHTDSQSVGLVELTEPENGEPIVKDLFHWNKEEPPFLIDAFHREIHFYFSEKHSETKKSKEKNNPPIFSAIRFLTKIFQYKLKVGDSEISKIKEIIRSFDPAKDIVTAYSQDWLEKNAKKILANAFDLEEAWNFIDKLGLRKKLIQIGNPQDPSSMAWFLNREPLRSLRTPSVHNFFNQVRAKDLRLDILSHETSDFQSYESIMKGPSIRPNLFISREHIRGESAAHGPGFYTSPGLKGAIGNGYTIRFRIDPYAIQNIDFRLEHGYVIILNRNIISIIHSRSHLSPKELLIKAGELKDDNSEYGYLLKETRYLQNRLRRTQDPEALREIFSILEMSTYSWAWNLDILKAGFRLIACYKDFESLIDRFIFENILHDRPKEKIFEFIHTVFLQMNSESIPQSTKKIKDILSSVDFMKSSWMSTQTLEPLFNLAKAVLENHRHPVFAEIRYRVLESDIFDIVESTSRYFSSHPPRNDPELLNLANYWARHRSVIPVDPFGLGRDRILLTFRYKRPIWIAHMYMSIPVLLSIGASLSSDLGASKLMLAIGALSYGAWKFIRIQMTKDLNFQIFKLRRAKNLEDREQFRRIVFALTLDTSEERSQMLEHGKWPKSFWEKCSDKLRRFIPKKLKI